MSAACNVTSDEATSYLWLGGVSASIVASVLTTFGNIMLKQAQTEQQERPAGAEFWEPVAGIIMSRHWWMGFGLGGLLPIPLQVLAFSLASQSIVGPLGAVTLLLTQVIGPRFLEKETVSRLDFAAGLIITVGVMVTSAFGVHAETEYELDDLKELWKVPVTVVVQVLAFLSIFLAVAAVKSPLRRYVSARASPLLFAYIAGAIGGQQNILFKGASEILSSQIAGTSNSFGDEPFLSLVWILAVIGLAVTQVSYLNQGLARYDAVFFGPLYAAMLVLCATVFGMIYFLETKCFEPLNWAMFSLGFVAALLGVLLLTHGKDLDVDSDANAKVDDLEGLDAMDSKASSRASSATSHEDSASTGKLALGEMDVESDLALGVTKVAPLGLSEKDDVL